MSICKVEAIIRSSLLEQVEDTLKQEGVDGITVTQVKGFGEYKNFFTHDWLVEHTKIEIYLPEEDAGEIADAILSAAHTGDAGDGIVVIRPVKEMWRIRSQNKLTDQ